MLFVNWLAQVAHDPVVQGASLADPAYAAFQHIASTEYSPRQSPLISSRNRSGLINAYSNLFINSDFDSARVVLDEIERQESATDRLIP